MKLCERRNEHTSRITNSPPRFEPIGRIGLRGDKTKIQCATNKLIANAWVA